MTEQEPSASVGVSVCMPASRVLCMSGVSTLLHMVAAVISSMVVDLSLSVVTSLKKCLANQERALNIS